MEAMRSRGWWKRWILWWKTDPEELRREVEGYAAITIIGTARGFGCLLAILTGVSMMIFGGFLLWRNSYGPSLWYGLASLTCGFLFSILGGFIFRGKPWAMIGAMAWWTLFINRSVTLAHGYFSSPIEYAAWLAASALGWTTLMHVFYVALRIERVRRARGPAAIAAGQAPPC